MTDVTICNEALTAIGEKVIVTLSDNSKAARLCTLKYANKRDYLLRKYIWNFATKRATLTPATGTPEYEYSTHFDLPDDCILLRELYPNTIKYSIEDNKILCDESTLCIKYTYRVTDTDKMDASFIETLSALLARELSIPLADNTNLSSQMDELYEVKLSEARFLGSIEKDVESIEANDWINSRY